MSKKWIIILVVIAVLLPIKASAYMIDFTSHEGLSGSAWADVQGDGTNQLTFDIGLAPGTIADIRSFFFNVEDGLPVTSFAVNSLTDMNNDFSVSNVVTSWPVVSPNANMNGTGITFDIGFEFGDQGVGNNKGDIRSVNFTVFSDSNLTLGENFGLRLMSFGENRQGSRKMVGTSSNITPVPEPSTMLLFGFGVLAVARYARKKRK